jgi:hypothetical protein
MAGGALMPVPTVAIETWNPAVPAAELIVTVQAVADPGAMLLGLHMKPVSDCPKARALREDRNNAVEARRRDIFIYFLISWSGQKTPLWRASQVRSPGGFAQDRTEY